MRSTHLQGHTKRLGLRRFGVVAVGTRLAAATVVVGLSIFAAAATASAKETGTSSASATAKECVPRPNADLEGCDFAKANLAKANFTDSNLTDANFTKANLTKAKLGKTNRGLSFAPRCTRPATTGALQLAAQVPDPFMWREIGSTRYFR